jgi:hypothetical protein
LLEIQQYGDEQAKAKAELDRIQISEQRALGLDSPEGRSEWETVLASGKATEVLGRIVALYHRTST